MTAQATHEGEKVTTYLTGGKSVFGGREQPLYGHQVYCSCGRGCQFRQNGQCVCVPSRMLALSWCPYGNEHTAKGYTSRAQRYFSFKMRYEDDPTYMALQGVGDMAYLRLVGDYAYLHLPELRIAADREGAEGTRVGRDGQIRIGNPIFGGTETWLKQGLIDVEAIIAICESVPRSSWTGERLDSYQEKTVPAFIEDLRIHWPAMYAELESARPDLCGREVDYRGRKARIATLRAGIALPSFGGNKFVLSDDRTELRCDDFRDISVRVGTAKARGGATVVLPVGEDDVIEVKDNAWVVPGETTFV